MPPSNTFWQINGMSRSADSAVGEHFLVHMNKSVPCLTLTKSSFQNSNLVQNQERKGDGGLLKLVFVAEQEQLSPCW